MSWTDEYREIVEFYYWEPQHIGRAASGVRFKNADEMYAHINQLEVSLNHVLNIFLSLFPLHKLACFEADQTHRMLTAWQLEEYARAQKNATQPDIFFVGQDSNIALELKLGSKSSLDQVLKYIRFNTAIAEDAAKPLTIYFLAPNNNVTKLFKERYTSLEELHEAVQANGLPLPAIKFLSYHEFYTALSTADKAGETETRLVDGLLTYLDGRANELRLL